MFFGGRQQPIGEVKALVIPMVEEFPEFRASLILEVRAPLQSVGQMAEGGDVGALLEGVILGGSGLVLLDALDELLGCLMLGLKHGGHPTVHVTHERQEAKEDLNEEVHVGEIHTESAYAAGVAEGSFDPFLALLLSVLDGGVGVVFVHDGPTQGQHANDQLQEVGIHQPLKEIGGRQGQFA